MVMLGGDKMGKGRDLMEMDLDPLGWHWQLQNHPCSSTSQW